MNEEKKKELIRTVKFVLFSISAGIIEIGSFTLMNELMHLYYWISYLISVILSVVWNFTFNRKFTFKSANNITIAMLETLGFYVLFIPLSTLLENYLTDIAWNEYLVTGINMVLNFVLEYLFDRFFVYRTSLDTAVQVDIKKNNQE